MLFNSVQYLIFLPICIILYFSVPVKYRNLFLLLSSYFFYMCWMPEYILLLMLSTVVTWLGGFFIEKTSQKTLRKVVLFGTIFINLSILFLFKYYSFFGDLTTLLFKRIGVQIELPSINLLLPVGISFYTFQALGYSIDVYRGEILHERNIINYALFVSFFPQLVAGPIERSKNLLPQFKTIHSFDAKRATEGLRIILIGMFKKVAVADMAALYVDNVFARVDSLEGFTLALAVFLFTIQIYCDFSGYSDIARGTALILGFKLMENFQAPYFATSITEFWQRWHISLSTWLRDYIYIPLGGNKRGFTRKCINLLIVFGISGLWHGAALTFVVWGGIHGICRVLEECIKKAKIIKNNETGIWKNIKTVISHLYCFFVVSFAWIFFRAESLGQALKIIKRMTIRFSIVNFGMDLKTLVEKIMPEYDWMYCAYYAILVIGILFIVITDYQRIYRHKKPEDVIASHNVIIRWLSYYILTIVTMFCFVMTTNEYGQAGAFLYFQF